VGLGVGTVGDVLGVGGVVGDGVVGTADGLGEGDGGAGDGEA
jgi:hypothetical protein